MPPRPSSALSSYFPMRSIIRTARVGSKLEGQVEDTASQTCLSKKTIGQLTVAAGSRRMLGRRPFVRLLGQSLRRPSADRPVLHGLDQRILGRRAVFVPPLRRFPFRLELRPYARHSFVRHDQNPLRVKYCFTTRRLASKAVIGRTASPRMVHAITSTRTRFVCPTLVYHSSSFTTSAPRSHASLANACSTSSRDTLCRAISATFASSQSKVTVAQVSYL